MFEQTFLRAPVPICLIGLDRRLIAVNDALCQVLGWDADDLIGRSFNQFTHPDDADVDLPLIGDVLAGTREGYEVNKRYLHRDGWTIDSRLHVSVVRDAHGTPEYFIAQGIDRTAAQALRAQLSTARNQLQAILDHSPMAIYLRDLDQRWLVVNSETVNASGRTREELIGTRFSDVYPQELVDAVLADEAKVLESGTGHDFDNTAVDARTGETHYWWTHRFPVFDDDGEIVAIGGITTDVTEREREQRELVKTRALLEAAFHHGPVAKLISRYMPDGTTVIETCNTAFTEILGWTEDELQQLDGKSLIHPDDQEARAPMLEALLAGETPSAEMRMLHRDGHGVWMVIAPSIVRLAEDDVLFVMQAVDISDRKRYEEELRHVAEHDALTGLPNRRRLDDELEREVARVRRHDITSCLLLLDLDGFKAVNDTLGHGAGDLLLAKVGGALSRELRNSDLVARLGGDEFAIILANTDRAGAEAVAAKLTAAVREHGVVTEGNTSLNVSASIGLTMLTGATCAASASLLAQADAAMYVAKSAGKDRVAVHEPPSDLAAAA